jgi:hypothetical protein
MQKEWKFLLQYFLTYSIRPELPSCQNWEKIRFLINIHAKMLKMLVNGIQQPVKEIIYQEQVEFS